MNNTKKTFLYIILAFAAIVFTLPIFWIIVSSFKTRTELFSWPPTLIPNELTFQNYFNILNSNEFIVYFKNTSIVAVLSTIITLLINSMAGFALAKYKFKGRNIVFLGFLAVLMIPLEIRMVPTFTIIRSFGLYDKLAGIIIPPAASPTGVFLIRQYMITIPDELMESARIDGASEWRIFWSIMLPLVKPALIALTIFSFMWRWNDFLNPFIVINSPSKYTLQIAIANFVGQYGIEWSSLLPMNVISMIPVLLVFLFFQRYFVKGIAMSGLKM